VNQDLDLDAYLARIQWGGPTPATFATLAGLLDAHMRAIPFENLDVLLGRPVRLDLGALQAKLVRARRGGYCFEHATLFAAVLGQLGFRPILHTARVVLMRPRQEAPRTHMIVSVALEDRVYLLDPGFGALAPRMPVPLVDSAPQAEATHWMARDGVYWLLHARTGGKVADCWITTLEPEHRVDFELGNHYTATHPESPFVNNLFMRALVPDGRMTVMNRNATLWRGDTPQAIEIADRAALRRLVAEHFGFDLPDILHLRIPAIAGWQ